MKHIVIEAIELHKKLVDKLKNIEVIKLVEISKIISESLKQGGCIYICGNGGSAADAQHIAGEFIGKFKLDRKALPAVALTTDTSVLTSIGNDYGFDFVFSRQVEALVKPNDILWVISTSGLSSNIISAAKLAKKKGAKVIAFTGKPSSKIEKNTDICLFIDSTISSSIQEIHQLAYHIVCSLVEEKLS